LDINFKEIMSLLGTAYFVAKNISQLKAPSFCEVEAEAGSTFDVEQNLIEKHVSQISIKGLDPDKEKELTKALMQTLDKEKNEGEKVADFEKRVFADALKVLGVEI